MAAGFSKPLKTFPIGQSQQQAIDSNISNKNETLWCLLDPVLAFSELARVLKKGGTMIVGDSNKYAHMESDEVREAYVEKWRNTAETTLRLIYGVTCSRATVIDDVWDKLPLSKCIRPQWDLDAAASLGLDFCCQATVPETASSPESFLLKFRKI